MKYLIKLLLLVISTFSCLESQRLMAFFTLVNPNPIRGGTRTDTSNVVDKNLVINNEMEAIEEAIEEFDFKHAFTLINLANLSIEDLVRFDTIEEDSLEHTMLLVLQEIANCNLEKVLTLLEGHYLTVDNLLDYKILEEKSGQFKQLLELRERKYQKVEFQEDEEDNDEPSVTVTTAGIVESVVLGGSFIGLILNYIMQHNNNLRAN